MDAIWLLPVLAGILNGTAWSLTSIFKRLPAAYFTGASFIVAGLLACVWVGVEGVPKEIAPNYWSVLLLNALLLAVAFTLANAAPRVSDLTLARPINPLCSVLMFVSGPVLASLGVAAVWSTPNAWGTVGIVIMVASLIFLAFSGTKTAEPSSASRAAKYRGMLMMLVVVVLYSITSFYDLIALRASSSAFYLATIFLLIGLVCLVLGALDRSFFFLHLEERREDYRNCWSLRNVAPCVLFGALYFSATALHMVTIDATSHIFYVVAIKEGLTAIDSAVVTIVLIKGVAWRLWTLPEGVYRDKEKEYRALPLRFPPMVGVALGIFVVLLFGIR